MKIVIAAGAEESRLDATVLPVFKGESTGRIFSLYPELEEFVRREKFKAAAGESVVFYSGHQGRLLVLAGAGRADRARVADISKCAKTIIKELEKHKTVSAELCFLGQRALSKRFWGSFIDFLFLGQYRFDGYKTTDKAPRIDTLFISGPNGACADLTGHQLKERKQVGENIDLVRDMVNEPAAKANPDYMVDMFDRVSSKYKKLDLTVWRRQELEAEKCNGLSIVGGASPYEPALLRLDYRPAKALATVAVVGKGVTFDTGGLNIKTGSYMQDMKSDMGGAAAVLGVMKTAAALKLPVAISGFAAVAENSVGRQAYRPGDIITYSNKKTVEVLNTDAEGRLMLADALILAARQKPDYIVELSTLTGSAHSTFGNGMAALMSNHKRLAAMLLKAGENSGERLWQLPLPDDYKESIKSKTADLKNAGYGRASCIKAGLFLSEFTAKIPFAHIDMAGTAFLSRPNLFYAREGATGYGMRLVLEFLNILTRFNANRNTNRNTN